MTNIVNVGYRSTNYYALDINGGRLLVDCGWPGTLTQFTAEMKRKGVSLSQIKYVLATHFHPDHAGLVEDFKRLGAKLLLLESQRSAQQALLTGDSSFMHISPANNVSLTFAESRPFLETLGLWGEIIPTPGHSDDSITLILDEGYAFTGDLPPRFLVTDENTAAKASWDRISSRYVKQIFPAHGPSRAADQPS